MPYCVQFLDAAKKVVFEERAESWSETKVFELTPEDWPPHAATVRVLDPDGYGVLTLSKRRDAPLTGRPLSTPVAVTKPAG